ncbi:MAG: hypothetical protein RL385_825 [Pseudomonadota bacterium]|jgi:hypothetical protein
MALLFGGCGLTPVDLDTTTGGVLLFDGVEAISVARFDAARVEAAPANDLLLRSPEEGAVLPENLAQVGVAWTLKRGPPKPTPESPPVCEVRIDAGLGLLRAFVRGPVLRLPGEALRSLVKRTQASTLTLHVRCAKDAAAKTLLASAPVRLRLGPALLPAELRVVAADGLRSLTLPGQESATLAPEPASDQAFALPNACAEGLVLTADGSVQLLASGADLGATVAGDPAQACLAVDPRGSYLAVAGDERLQLYALDTGAALGGAALPAGERVTSLSTAPDGQTLYAVIARGDDKPMGKPQRIAAISIAAGEGGLALEAPVTLYEAKADEALALGAARSEGLWFVVGKGKPEGPRETRTLLRTMAGDELVEAFARKRDAGSDGPPQFLPSHDPNQGYLVFASTRPLGDAPTEPQPMALHLVACSPAGQCAQGAAWLSVEGDVDALQSARVVACGLEP